MIRNALLVMSAGLIMFLGAAQFPLATSQPHPKPAQSATTATSATVKPGNRTVPRAPLSSMGVPLTVDECKGLGGVVGTSNTCDSGQTCETAGANGVIHHACITKS